MPVRHILTYARSLRGGGVERAMLRLARGWLAAGQRVTLAIVDAEGPLAAELPEGLAVVRCRSLLALPGIVRARAPDILFCPGNHYTSIAAWTKLRLGRACPPIVGKMSNAPDRADHGPAMRALHALWLAQHHRFLDRLVAMTPATAREAARATRMAGRVTTIPNPPALAMPGAGPLALPADRFVLGVGRLEAQKRWDRLIAAMPMLDEVPLVILGEGSLRSALADQAVRLGVGDRVHLPGHAADPLAAMARATVVALTSDFEGVPGVLREALSVGTPVIATESSRAVAEIVHEPLLGTIVPRDDPAALVAALRAWLAADAVRPAPVPQQGADSAAQYLALFDALLDRSSDQRSIPVRPE